jgi:caffeoyl-CoA O-methyltransferase
VKSRPDAIIHADQARYLDALLPPRDELLSEMEAYASRNRQPIADPEVAQLMRMLVRLQRPRRLLEIGTNIGYSVVVLGRELDAGAVLETIEIDREMGETARAFTSRAGLSAGIVFHNGAALDVLPQLAGPFDFVFIDCVKTEYERYLDLVLPRMVVGGLIVCDNLLWKGEVAQQSAERSPEAVALDRFNRRIMSDPRLDSIILPLGDGVGLSVVRQTGDGSRE